MSAADAPVTLERLRAAIRRLYSPADPEATQAASRWLSAAKALPQAWQFLWPLLTPDKTPEEQFLAATFLRDKIREQWSDLSPEQAVELKTRVLETTVAAQGRADSCARALTEALAALAVQMTPDRWPEPVPDLTRACQTLSDPSLGARLLLSVLTELPSELERCVITSAGRASARANFKKHIPHVLELVLGLLQQSPSEPVASRCMELLAAWTELELLAADLFPILELVMVPFVASPALIGVTLDMLDRVVSSPHNYNYPATVLQLASRVLQLQPFIRRFVDDKEPESLLALGNVFTSLVASHSRTVVSALCGPDAHQAEVARRTVSAVLELASVPGRYPTDETVSELTFGVWYTIQDDILASDEHREALTAQLQPVYSSLLNVMLQKAMLPTDPAHYSPDEAEAFRRYRQDILDFYTYTQSLLGDYILNSFIIYLHGAVQAVRADPARWPALEAVLHGLTGLGESCEEELSLADGMRTVLLTLPEVPYSNSRPLMAATLRLVDACSACLELHTDCLPPLVPILLDGLHQPEVALYATMALKDICQEAPQAIAPHAAPVLAACKEVLAGGRLAGRECVRLMYVVGSLICSISDHQQRLRCMDDIIQPLVTEIKLITDESNLDKLASNKSVLVVRLNMLASLASALPAERGDWPPPLVHPLLLLLRELAPALQRLAQPAASDDVLAECICHVLQRSLSSLGDTMEPFVDMSLHVLSTLYSAEPHPQVLDLVRQMMLTWRQSGRLGPALQQVFGQLCAASLRYFSAEPGRHPEALIRFLEVQAQLLKKQPAYLSGVSEHVPNVFLLASGCTCQPDRRMVRAACSLLAQLCSRAAESELFSATLRSAGASLVQNLLTAIGGAVPRDCLDQTADVLLALSRWDCGRLQQWLTALLSQPDFPSRRAADADKKAFIKHVLQSRNSKTFLRSKIGQFSQQCRGMHGTEYGAATLNTAHFQL